MTGSSCTLQGHLVTYNPQHRFAVLDCVHGIATRLRHSRGHDFRKTPPIYPGNIGELSLDWLTLQALVFQADLQPATCVKVWWSLLLLFVGCLTSKQYACVSQGRICSDSFTCCHAEIEVADPTFYLTQSQYTDTALTNRITQSRASFPV